MNNHSPPKSTSSSPSGSDTMQRQLHGQGAAKPKPRRPLPSPVQVNLYAQKLNNSAAFCIEIGQYDRATVSLTKALRLLDLHKDHELEDACQCQDCTIETCISYSQKLPSSSHAILACSHRSKKQKTVAAQPQQEQQEQAATKTSLFKSHFWKPEETETETNTDGKAQPSTGSVYRRPIQVCPRTMREGHNMGSTLILIVVFNLALAHHCSVLSQSKQQQNSCTSNEDKQRQRQPRAKLQTTLKLYDLADSWYSKHKTRHQQYSNNSHTDPFGMILCNNLCHIHRSLNDPAKHQESLQRLTSTLMVAVDHKKTNTAVEQVQQVQVQVQVQVQEQSQDVDDSSAARDNKHNHLEGFLQTASQLILRNQCADAA